jgi:uncharacterized membrane protein
MFFIKNNLVIYSAFFVVFVLSISGLYRVTFDLIELKQKSGENFKKVILISVFQMFTCVIQSVFAVYLLLSNCNI